MMKNNLLSFLFALWISTFFSFFTFYAPSGFAQILTEENVDIYIKDVIAKKDQWDKENKNIPANKKKFYLFADFDGTITYGDITEGVEAIKSPDGKTIKAGFEGLAQKVIENKLIKQYQGKEGFKQYLEIYTKLVSSDKPEDKADSVRLCESIFHGLNKNEMEKVSNFVERYMKSTLSKKIFVSSKKIIQELKKHGIEFIVTSASPSQYVSQIYHMIPEISPKHLWGVDPKDKNLNFREGKKLNILDKIEKMEKENPGLKIFTVGAMGNSWSSDGPFIEEIARRGGIGLFINGKEGEMKTSLKNIYQGKFTKILDEI